MSADDLVRQKEIFFACLEVGPEHRDAYLKEACKDNRDLLSRVEELLRSHDRSDHWDVSPWNQTPHSQTSTGEDPLIAKEIAGFQIRSKIASGAMGVVYLAEQRHPDRQVALKMLHPGLTSKTMVERFEIEARVLGRLQHPAIAQIYEAGTADLGLGPQPYFAMEYVNGVSVTRFVRDQGLSLAERLRLLIQICHAVQHAHSKGVIHRDLKPSNVLIDPDGNPKVLDFGVSRSSEPNLHAGAMRTMAGELLGTLPYMSPEQVGGDPDQIDTRSDVYSLGVLGYQMLSGRLPYPVLERPFLEAALTILEEEPSRLSAAGVACEQDLDAVFLMALEKDRERRYQSPTEFAADLERYLQDLPVLARPHSAVYQFKKFVRRHRGWVASVAVSLLLLIAGTIGTAWQAVEANRSSQEARIAAEESIRILHVLENVLAPVDRILPNGPTTTVRELLDQAEPSIHRIRAVNPKTAAALFKAFGKSYQTLGLLESSQRTLEQGIELQRQLVDSDPLELAQMLWLLGTTLRESGNHDEAAVQLLEAQGLAESAGAPAKELSIEIHIELAALESDRGGLAAAAEHLDRAFSALGDFDEQNPTSSFALALKSLADLSLRKGEIGKAERAARLSVKILEQVCRPGDARTLRAQALLERILSAREVGAAKNPKRG